DQGPGSTRRTDQGQDVLLRHRRRHHRAPGARPSRQHRAHHPGQYPPAGPATGDPHRKGLMMARRRGPARHVDPADLGSYQQAVRRVLTCDLITATRPRPGTLDQVLRWADHMTEDLRALFGHTLIATTDHVRLVRELDELDP